MRVEVKVPLLAESVPDATLLAWHKKEGDFVRQDENLIDVETDKVIFELPAPATGKLMGIRQPDGATVASEEVIAEIDTEAVAEAAPAPAAPAPAAAPTASAPTATPAAAAEAAPLSPAVRKMVAEHGLEAGQIEGSGRGGRVTKGDVLALLATQKAPGTPAAEAAPPQVGAHVALAGERPEQRVPMTRLRQRVAERLLAAQAQHAILTTFNEINMQPVMELRRRYQERFQAEYHTKLGYMSFFVKACVAALKKYPVINASVDGSDIVYHGYYDIGVAVSSPRGLVVPILRDVDHLGFAEIESGIAAFSQQAQEGTLKLEDLTGGTFTITNGGIFGSMMSTPILNPPQSAILGMHAITERAVVEQGQVVVRPMMYVALSYDHCLIDGRDAVLFLAAVKDALEDPTRLLLQI